MGRDKRSAGAPSSSAGAGGEQAAGADGSLARSDCAVCKKEVAVGSEDYITARCKRCGTLPLHPECVADELARAIKAEWTSGRQTLATYTKRLQKRPWEVLGERVRTGQRCFACSEGGFQAVDLCKAARKVAAPLPQLAPAAKPKKAAAQPPAVAAAAGGPSASSAKRAPQPRQQVRQVVQPLGRQEAFAPADGPTFAQLQAEEAAKAAAAQAAQEQQMRQQAAERRAKEEAARAAAAQAAQEDQWRRQQRAWERDAAERQAREAAERREREKQEQEEDIELAIQQTLPEAEARARLLESSSGDASGGRLQDGRRAAVEDSWGAVPTPPQGVSKSRPLPHTPSGFSGGQAEGAGQQQPGTEDSCPAGRQQAPAGEAAAALHAAPDWSAGEWRQAPPQQLLLPLPLAHQQLHPMQPHSLHMLPPQQQPQHLFPPQLLAGQPLSPRAHSHGSAFQAGFEAGMAAILAQGGGQMPVAPTPQPNVPTWLQPHAAQAAGLAAGTAQWAHAPGHLPAAVAPAALGQPLATADGKEVDELMAMMGIADA